MRKNIGKILLRNLLPPLISVTTLSTFIFMFFIPELDSVSRSAGNNVSITKDLLPYTIVLLAVLAGVSIFSAIHNLRIELSREKLKKSYKIIDNQYQTYIETTADGFILIDENLIMNANCVILDILEYSIEELRILNPGDIIDNDADGAKLLDVIKKNDDEISGRYEIRLIKNDKSTVEVLVSASKITTPFLNGCVLIIKDMSEKTRTDALRIDFQREDSIMYFQSALQYIYQYAGSMMIEPLLIFEKTKIIEAVEKMNCENKNTFVAVDADGFPSGIVTDQDLRKRVISGEVDKENPVSRIMSRPVITAGPELMFFEAFRKMRDNSIRQLVITDDEGKPDGILTEKKLIEIQSTNSAVLFEELKKAKTVPQLQDSYRQLGFTIRNLVLSGARAANVTSVVTGTAETITTKLIKIALLKFGPAPCEFAYLAMGSEGRGEQTLLTDQDNGIIFSDADEEKVEICRKYFLRLGKFVSDSLNTIGYSYCKGGIMTSNPKWVRSKTEWRNQFLNWVSGASSEKMLDVNIIFDFKCIYGDNKLSSSLRSDLWSAINRFPTFLREMATSVSEFKPPINLFGRIQVKHTEYDEEVFDIKKAITPLIIYARTLALSEKIPASSTSARLRALKEKEIIKPHEYRSYAHAFEYLTLLRFRNQIRSIEEGKELSNLIYIEDLMEVEIITLRKIFKQISDAQDELRFTFTGSLR